MSVELKTNQNKIGVREKITRKQGNNNSQNTIDLLNRKEKRNLRRLKLKIGETCFLKISALGPKGIGIDEYSYPYSIFVPNVSLGDLVKAKLVKLNSGENKFGVAQKLEIIKKSTVEVILPVQPDDEKIVNIEKVNSKQIGIVDLKGGYKLFIPNAKIGQSIPIQITRVKSKYAFGKQSPSLEGPNLEKSGKRSILSVNSKYTLTLPKKFKYSGKYALIKLDGSPLFIRLGLTAKPGAKVRIKITQAKSNFALAKIIQISPISSFKKRILIQHNIREMIKNGMHLGEKAVRCNARMKNYVWLKKQNVGLDIIKRPLIKKGRHLINLLKTRRCLNKALSQLSKYALKGRTFLFIGTKKPASGLIARASLFSKTSFFVNTRWLGGMLTNWKTILKSISKIRPILKEKQRIIADILERRQSIKARLIRKALLLKKKSRLILTKGRFLIEQFRNQSVGQNILEKAKKLTLKRTQLLDQCYSLLSKRKVLISKRKEIMYQSIRLKEKAILISGRYKVLLNQLLVYSKKLRELKLLLTLTQEIRNIKQNKEIINLSYTKIKELSTNDNPTLQSILVPNPPKDLVNILLLAMKNQLTTASSSNSLTKSVMEKGPLVLITSKLVSNFSRFSPYLINLIQQYEININKLQNSLSEIGEQLISIKNTFKLYSELKTGFINELNGIKLKLLAERQTIRLVRTKIKNLISQKKLIKFLPRLRYLSTPLFSSKIKETVQLLMKKIVDPKFKYPVDEVYEEKLQNNTKKESAARKKKWQRLEKYFGGIANMTKMNKSQISKSVAIIIGQREDINAVNECKKLGITMFNIVDTDCNPSLANHIIPANDDSRKSIKYVLNKFLIRIRLAQKLRKKLNQKALKEVKSPLYYSGKPYKAMNKKKTNISLHNKNNHK
jgi:small subunit ribosomal protein S2